MNLLLRILLITAVIIISDYYFFRLLKQNFFSSKKNIRILKIACIIFSVCFLLFEMGIYAVFGYPEDNFIKYRQLFLVLDAFVLVYLPKSFSGALLIIYDIVRFLFYSIFRRGTQKSSPNKLIYRIGFLLYFLILGITIYGFVYTKTDIAVRKIDIKSSRLPRAFDRFTLIQISDLHLGSYTDTQTFGKAVNLINDLKPDMLVMTGDIINVSYKEAEPFISFFNKINPPYGKYSILGNHDIGDYFSIKHPANQEWLTQQLIATEKQMGFRLLVDSSCYIKKGKDSIAILGINNCGTYPFLHSGNLDKAMRMTKNSDFRILLSHDPDEWQDEILSKTNIDLTLSGHTHAMQLAFICGSIRISPSALKYKNWYGLYQTAQQFIYVNPGLGFSGFAGRIGTRPEITVITLKSVN